MGRPVHFELGVVDPERAAKFYEAALGWKISKWDGPMPYWMINTGEAGPGINGGMMIHMDKAPRTVNTMGVADLDAAVAKVVEAGGTMAHPKFPIPGIGWQAYCIDTEGNLFGLHQMDPSAK